MIYYVLMASENMVERLTLSVSRRLQNHFSGVDHHENLLCFRRSAFFCTLLDTLLLIASHFTFA